MVYDWDGKQDECYRLYVQEKRPLDVVMEHFREHYDFAPSKRAWQTQFKRWNFPSKHNPPHKQAPLVARIKELWEGNTSQTDMIQTLKAEGYEITDRQLMRVRAHHRWLLRTPNAPKEKRSASEVQEQDTELAQQQEAHEHEHEQELSLEHRLRQLGTDRRPPEEYNDAGDQPQADDTQTQESPEPPPEILQQRQVLRAKLQEESDERWRTRKRRRRTRGWAGLPPDPQGPPRFPSETTIDESKAFLRLDNAAYRQIREEFQNICIAESVAKKTLAGADKWRSVKDRLIRENSHLQDVFYHDMTQSPEQKELSLDVICTDVTKRMRTQDNRMSIPDAKNALNINPSQSREVRESFYNILKQEHFISKLETGSAHWEGMKQAWIAGSVLLQSILAAGEQDPDHEKKRRALEVICRDVMKRLRDEQVKLDPTRKKQVNFGPGPGPAPPRVTGGRSGSGSTWQNPDGAVGSEEMTMPTAEMQHRAMQAQQQQLLDSDLQIDPSLLLAASNEALGASMLHTNSGA